MIALAHVIIFIRKSHWPFHFDAEESKGNGPCKNFPAAVNCLHITHRNLSCSNSDTQAGPGLAVVHETVELTGGDNRVEGNPGKGTTMAPQLPCRPEESIENS